MNNEQFQELVLQELRDLKTDVQGIKSDVAGVKTDVKRIESDVQGLKSEVQGVKSEVQGVKSEVQGLKSEVSEIKADVKVLIRKMDTVYEQTAGLTEFRTEVANAIGGVLDDQKSIVAIVGDHEVQIRNLQRKLTK